MAHFYDPTPEQQAGWAAWVASRPEAVRLVAERFDPWSLYRMKATGQRVTIYSFSEHEDGSVTATVTVSGEFNEVLFDRQVFGVNPDDLSPCELPTDADMTGAAMTPTQVEDNLDALRVIVRPDLWELDADGTAVLKPGASPEGQ